MLKKLITHKDKLILMQLAILQILISFLTNYIIVKKIGFGNQLDIFYLAMAVYLFLHTSVNWSIAAVLTPILIENSENKIEGQLFINILLIVSFIFIASLLSINFWSNLIFTNYLEKVNKETINTIQTIFLFTFLLEGLNILFFSIMQRKNEFIKINLLNLIVTIIGFLFVYFTINSYGIYSASYAQIIMKSILFLFLFFYLFDLIKINFYFEKKTFLILWNRMKYIFIGSFYFRLNDIMDKFISSYLTSGFLSLVSFIQKLYEASNTVLNTSITAPTITKFSNLIKNNNYEQIKITINKYLIFLFLLNSIIFIFIYFLGESLFLFLFEERIEISLIPILFSTLISIFIICYTQTMGKILQNLLLSLKAEKEITKYDVISFTISILLKIIFTYYFSVIGFLISFILSELIKVLFKYYLVQKLLMIILK